MFLRPPLQLAGREGPRAAGDGGVSPGAISLQIPTSKSGAVGQEKRWCSAVCMAAIKKSAERMTY